MNYCTIHDTSYKILRVQSYCLVSCSVVQVHLVVTRVSVPPTQCCLCDNVSLSTLFALPCSLLSETITFDLWCWISLAILFIHVYVKVQNVKSVGNSRGGL